MDLGGAELPEKHVMDRDQLKSALLPLVECCTVC